MSLFVADIPGDENLPDHRFYASRRIDRDTPSFDGLAEQDLASRVRDLWSRAWRAKEPETKRLQTNELLYAGFHYKNPADNRRNEVTNLCFSTVETVWPTMVELKPRPEIIPRNGQSYEVANKLQEFATWLMDNSAWDANVWRGTRTKLKYGWCVNLITIDHETGMPYPKQWSPFDFYPDPDATDESTLEYFFLAAPIQTSRLKAMFPDKADKIYPDGLTSPGYEVYIKPYFDHMDGDVPSIGGALSATRERWSDNAGTVHSDAAATTSSVLVDSPNGTINQNADTTFLLQLFVRDRSLMRVTYEGEREIPEASLPEGNVKVPGQYEDMDEPCCESGWRVIQMTATCEMLDDSPMDACFGGIPVVIGRDYWSDGRYYGIGELDHLAPINRAINRRKNLLNRALEFEALPILLVDRDIGSDFDQDQVEPGDVLRATRGARAEWLTYNGPAGQQFELLQLERADADNVTGVHDVQQGRKPAGIEAAAAIRSLQAAAQQRIRGKERPQGLEMATLLKKMMNVAAKKLQRTIFFRATSGVDMQISPQDLAGEYDIRFAEGSGMVSSKQEQEEKILQLFQLGVIDNQAVLERIGIPGWQQILMRQQAMQAQQMAIEMEAAKSGGKSNNAPPGGQ